MPPKQKPNGYSLYVSERCRQSGTEYKDGFGLYSEEWKSLDQPTKERYNARAKDKRGKVPNTNNSVISKNPTNEATRTILPRRNVIVDLVDTCKVEELEELYVPLQRPQFDVSHHDLFRNELATESKMRNDLFDIDDTYQGRMERKRPFRRRRFDDEDESDSKEECLEFRQDSGDSVSPPPPSKRRFLLGDDEGDFVDFEMEVPTLDLDEREDEELDDEMTKDHLLFDNVIRAYPNLQAVKNQHVFVISFIPAIYEQGLKKGANRPLNRPLEVALVVFSIAKGLEKIFYHSFIHPGTIPNHETIHAQESRVERHGIPYAETLREDDEYCDLFHQNGFKLSDDYIEIYKSILRTMGYDGKNARCLPPLLVPNKSLKINEACLRWLSSAQESCRQQLKNRPPVLPQLEIGRLEDFCRLAFYFQNTDSRTAFVYSDIDRELEDLRYYILMHKLNCNYHKLTSVKYCALGLVREAVFTCFHLLKEVYDLPNESSFIYLGENLNEVTENSDEKNVQVVGK